MNKFHMLVLVMATGLSFFNLSPARAGQTPEVAAQSGRRTMRAVRMRDDETIVVDGQLDEPVWRRAIPATDFIQSDPANGSPATERTEVRIAYNRTTLYMGVICFDAEPEKMLRFQQRRDEGLPSDDRLMWVIDPFLTGQNGYFFETNPSGLMGDALLGATGQNRQWDGIWTLHVHRSQIGWTFEVAIPFTTLNFDPNGASWGINFQRTVRRKNEESLWTGWGRNQGLQRLSNTGLVVGMNENVTQGLGLDVRPYGLAVADSSPATGKPSTTATAKAGLDVFYSPTPGLRVNFTLNTDFAQADVDQRVVNLTQFAVFFPEKRTFFLEGANFFEFRTSSTLANSQAGGFTRPVDNSIVPFFSRTIGLDANGNPQKINFGTKVIGQVARGLDVGILQVQTADDHDPAGHPVVGENVLATRVKRRFFRQSYVGGFYTYRDVRSGDQPALQTVGADIQLATSNFRGKQNLIFGGYFLNTSNPRGPGKSASFGAQVDYPNDRWNAGMSYRNVQDNFRPALGFTTRPRPGVTDDGYQRYSPYVNVSPRPRRNPWMRRMGFTIDSDLEADQNNQWLTRLWTLTVLNIDFNSQDTFSVLVLPEYERLKTTFRVAGTAVTLPIGREYSFVRYRVTGQSANRRLIAFTPTIEWGGFYSGTLQKYATDITLRARPGVIIYTTTEFDRFNLPEGGFHSRLFRATPELQFGQWVALVNTVQYDSVSRRVGWQSRFRWILTPGDDVFFVYTENWLDDPALNRLNMLNHSATAKMIYTRRF